MKQIGRAALFVLVALGAAPIACGLGVQRTELPNGLRVLAVEDPSSDIAAAQLLIGANAQTEPEAMAGLRAVLQQMVHGGLRERLRSEPDLQPLRDQEDAAGMGATGTAFAVATSWEFAQVTAQGTTDALPDLLRFLREAVFSPPLTQEVLAPALGVTHLGLDGERAAAPAEATSYLFRQAADGPTNPRARSIRGTHATLGGLDLAEVQAYHRRYYVPNLSCLCVVAALPAAETTRLVQESFGGLARGRDVETSAPPAPTQSAVRVTEDPTLEWNRGLPAGFQMASLIAGCPAPAYGDPDYAAATVILALLAGTDQQPGLVRQDDGLYRALGLEPLGVTTAHAREQGAVEPLPMEYGPCNHVAFHAYLTTRSLEGFSRGLLGHFERLAAAEPAFAEAQLAEAKTIALNQRAQTLEPRVTQALELARSELLARSWEFAAGFDDRLRAVTAADIQRVADTYFQRHAVGVRLPAPEVEPEEQPETVPPPGMTARR